MGVDQAAPHVTRQRTATDQVELGKTGIKLSRLGIGTGSNNGNVQRGMGKDGFTRFVHHAFERGITYIDTAQNYRTFEWIGDAIKDLPREKVYLLSKIPGRPEDVLANIDRHRSTFKTDYVDTMLIHCMVNGNWTEDWKRIMEGFDKAKERGWIRSKGVSCHSLPALRAANESDWNEVHLVRVNPQGQSMDAERDGARRDESLVQPVLEEIRKMHEKGRGVIGMKIIGNGTFTDPADRDKSIRFAMGNPAIHAVTIGMKTEREIDENIRMINEALKLPA